MIGEWRVENGVVYVVVNHGGTVRKMHKVRWTRILALFLLNLFGRCRHPQEVIEYLQEAPR